MHTSLNPLLDGQLDNRSLASVEQVGAERHNPILE